MLLIGQFFRRNLKIVQEIVLPRTYNLHKGPIFLLIFSINSLYLVFQIPSVAINLYLVKVVLLKLTKIQNIKLIR
jgi:hypothetical protein